MRRSGRPEEAHLNGRSVWIGRADHRSVARVFYVPREPERTQPMPNRPELVFLCVQHDCESPDTRTATACRVADRGSPLQRKPAVEHDGSLSLSGYSEA